QPITTKCTTVDELEYFKGSKYVQSLVRDCFHEIKEYLQQQRVVLYIATPCQIAGLYSYLKKDYSNLLTIDLICHGVSPTSYFNNEINYLKMTKKIS
ncbi:Coenzyme F420 hydrogenase/dehydrogenase, beta subunit C-terminal domain, partial [Bacteroides thetaiotaomicron]